MAGTEPSLRKRFDLGNMADDLVSLTLELCGKAEDRTPLKLEQAYFGWRQHAMKAKNARTQVLNMDAYLDGMLRKIGYRLIIYKVNHGKIKWRVCIAPTEGGKPCQEQSPSSQPGR